MLRDEAVTRDANSGRLDVLQFARGGAATAVVLYHANDFILPLRLYDGGIAWRGFGWGYAGVEFFFVLSGFIIAFVHQRDIGQPARVVRFLLKRVLRIYPMYWLVLTSLLLAYLLVPTLGMTRPESEHVLSAYLLWPSGERPVLPVAWTLKHEMLFYIVFVCLLIHAQFGKAVFLVWMGGCFICLFLPDLPFPAAFYLSPYNLLFAVGMAVFYIQPVLRQSIARTLTIAGVLLFVGVGMSEQFLFPWPLAARTLAYGFAAGLLVAGAIQLRMRTPAAAVLVGDASYAIYLVHLPVMNACAILLKKGELVPMSHPLLMCLALATAAVAAGVIFHLLVERPLQGWLSKVRVRRAARDVRAVTTGVGQGNARS